VARVESALILLFIPQSIMGNHILMINRSSVQFGQRLTLAGMVIWLAARRIQPKAQGQLGWSSAIFRHRFMDMQLSLTNSSNV